MDNNNIRSHGDKFFSSGSDKLVLLVFSFVDASDVLTISLTNRSLMNRIHVLFGVGNPVAVNGAARKPVRQISASPTPRPQMKARSQSFINPSEKERAQVLCLKRYITFVETYGDMFM